MAKRWFLRKSHCPLWPARPPALKSRGLKSRGQTPPAPELSDGEALASSGTVGYGILGDSRLWHEVAKCDPAAK